MEDEPGGVDSAPSDRRHAACNGLARLGRKLPAVLVGLLSQLSQRAQALIRSGVLPSTCDTLVLEMLISVSNAEPDPAKRVSFVAAVLSHSLGMLRSDEVKHAFSSPQNLLRFVALLPVPPGSQLPSLPKGAPPSASSSSDARRHFLLR